MTIRRYGISWGDYALVTIVVFILIEPTLLPTSEQAIAVICVVFLVYWWTRSRSRKRTLVVSRLVLALCALFFVSVCWSDQPTVTLRSSGIYTVLAISSLVFHKAYSPKQAIRLLSMAFLAIAMICVVVAVADPATGREAGSYKSGALQGIFVQKNLFAYAMVLGLLLNVCDPIRRRGSKIAIGLSYVILIFLASSSTALLIGGVAVGALMAMRMLVGSPLWRLVVVYTFGFTATGIALAITNFGAATEAVGRDTTLTGRTTIWSAVWSQIQERPLTGTGWGAAWGTESRARLEISRIVGFVVPHAHDGFLDIWLQVGVLGLVLLVAALLQLVRQGLYLVLEQNRSEFRWVAAFGLVLALYSIDEVRATKYLGWWLLCLNLTYCAAEYKAMSTAKADSLQVPTARELQSPSDGTSTLAQRPIAVGGSDASK